MKIEKKFCVIGPEVSESNPIGRNFFATDDQAANHAAGKLTGDTNLLYVVKIVKVVRRKPSYVVDKVT